MSLNQFNCESVSDSETSIIYTPTATSANVTAGLVDHEDTSSGVPSDGSTVIIRSISSGHVITLLDGQVVLASPGGRGSIHWSCVETEGWLGFRNRISNKFLCHDWNGRLKCSAEQSSSWRHFTITPIPKGGYVMQMLDWWTLRPVVINPEQGLQKIGRTGNKLAEGIIWEFIKVE
ncbi:uncharacterized protein CC84DRAFT_242146 [Paraphaeosphaeria sporulosa]|uniref:Ricin B lectin domain-containing protein n=1 Tax=Paraphaeosphaeria sporulosa TaxID=1460663 RepID=A0A177C4P3_9PLEO|nr:uncharacterized protein CC84DRAFT_242146 [Paraphaeosphaeria sporulosa]OAG01842.1 hypothetical protein CC84DRAFT_242146 [Paraphaeosphaeria sporulosa]